MHQSAGRETSGAGHEATMLTLKGVYWYVCPTPQTDTLFMYLFIKTLLCYLFTQLRTPKGRQQTFQITFKIQIYLTYLKQLNKR